MHGVFANPNPGRSLLPSFGDQDYLSFIFCERLTRICQPRSDLKESFVCEDYDLLKTMYHDNHSNVICETNIDHLFG